MTTVERFLLALLGLAGLTSIAGSNAGFGGLFLFFLFRLLTGRWRGNLPAALLLGILLWGAASALFSPFRADALHSLKDSWAWLAILAASALAPETKSKLEFYSLPLSISALAASSLAACGFLFGTRWKGESFFDAAWAHQPSGAFFSHHLTLAGAASVAAFFLAGQALYCEYPRWRRILLWAGVSGCAVALLFSQARSYYLACIPAALVLLLGKGWKRAAAAALAGTLLAVAMLALGPATLRQRALSIFDSKNASNTERIYLWRAGWDMLKERPVLGWGPGTYKEASPPYRQPYAQFVQHEGLPRGFQTDCHAHNLYLQTALDTGLVGLGLFLAFMGSALWAVWRCRDTALRWGVAAAALAFCIGGLFEYNGGDAEVSTLFFFLLGLPLGISRPSDQA